MYILLLLMQNKRTGIFWYPCPPVFVSTCEPAESRILLFAAISADLLLHVDKVT